MRKFTQAEFDAIDRNEYGYKVLPGNTDYTDVDFHGEDKLIFGDCATLGNWAKLGHRATLGKNASFESGSVKNGRFITVGMIGSENRTAYFFRDGDGNFFVRAGCWFSDIDAFVERVHEVHGGTKHERDYLAACEYAKIALAPFEDKEVTDET